jgi:hypothetical protein
MPVTIDWGNAEKTISHMKFVRPWNWDEYYAAYQKGYEMTESVDHKVNIIMDFTESAGHLPPSALTHFRRAASTGHPRRGVVVLTTPRMMLVKAMVSMIQKIGLMKTTILFANTIEEAYSTLNHIIENKPETIPLR